MSFDEARYTIFVIGCDVEISDFKVPLSRDCGERVFPEASISRYVEIGLRGGELSLIHI